MCYNGFKSLYYILEVGGNMAIGSDKTRVMVTITEDEKAMLEKIAKEQNRNMSNLIGTIIKDFLNKESNQE